VTGGLDRTVRVWDLGINGDGAGGGEVASYGFDSQIFSIALGTIELPIGASSVKTSPSKVDPNKEMHTVQVLIVGLETPQIQLLTLPQGLGGPPGEKIELNAHDECVLGLKFGPTYHASSLNSNGAGGMQLQQPWFVSTSKDRKWVGWVPNAASYSHQVGSAGGVNGFGGMSGFEMGWEVKESASILCVEVSGCGDFVVTGSGDNVANVYRLEY
jgi:WD40 repeat protein